MKSISASERNITTEIASPSVIRGIFITFLFTVGLVVAKQVLEPHGLRMPGSSGVYWMALLLLNRHFGMGRGAGTVMGIGAGAITWGFFSGGVGLGMGMGIIAKYFVSGFIVDLLYREFKTSWVNAISWGGIGAAANAVKFVVHATAKSATGTFSWALIFGKWNALGTHILFGFVGGLIAFGIVYAAILLKKKSEAGSK